MEESLMKYIETLPSGVRFIVIVVLVCSVLIIPSIGNIGKFIQNICDHIKGVIRSITKKSEEHKKRKEDERKFREQVSEIAQRIPDIYDKINSVVKDMDNVMLTSVGISNRNHELEDTIHVINSKLEDISNTSAKNDKKLSENYEKNRQSIDYLVDSMNELNVKVRLLVDGDLDNFRTHLMQIYNQCILGSSKLTRRDISILKTKYKRYRAEGGNGWAKRLLDEIIASLDDEELVDFFNSAENDDK